MKLIYNWQIFIIDKFAGLKYAMISMKVILATLIRTFVFKLNQSIEIDKIKLISDILLSLDESIKIRIDKRISKWCINEWYYVWKH